MRSRGQVLSRAVFEGNASRTFLDAMEMEGYWVVRPDGGEVLDFALQEGIELYDMPGYEVLFVVDELNVIIFWFYHPKEMLIPPEEMVFKLDFLR